MMEKLAQFRYGLQIAEFDRRSILREGARHAGIGTHRSGYNINVAVATRRYRVRVLNRAGLRFARMAYIRTMDRSNVPSSYPDFGL